MRAKASPLAVKARRLALPIDKNPTFEALGDGISVGYRRCAGAGTWVARRSDGKGGKIVKRIGLADDYDDADGTRILTWAQAQAAALAFDPLAAAAIPDKAPTTVSAALDTYETDLKTRGGDLSNVGRLRLHVSDDLLQKAIRDLKVGDLRQWRDRLAGTLAPATVNRVATAFKAALNRTTDADDRIVSRSAWEKGLKALPDAEEARNIILPDAQVKAIVEGAYDDCIEVGLLVEVAAVTGARYGQIAGLLIEDLQDDRPDPRVMMPSSKKGKGLKKVLRRPVPIPKDLGIKLRLAAGERPAGEPLLLKRPRPQTNEEKRAGIQPLPEPWQKSDHYRPFKRVMKAVIGEPEEDKEADSDPITIYALRHSSIVRQILAGVPVRVVAVLHDTSIQMIEKNYSKFLADHADSLARGALLDLGRPSAECQSAP